MEDRQFTKLLCMELVALHAYRCSHVCTCNCQTLTGGNVFMVS